MSNYVSLKSLYVRQNRNLGSRFSGKKLIKIVATGCSICTKIDFVWGSAPDAAGGSLQRSPDPITAIKKDLFLKGKGAEGGGRKGGEGTGWK